MSEFIHLAGEAKYHRRERNKNGKPGNTTYNYTFQVLGVILNLDAPSIWVMEMQGAILKLENLAKLGKGYVFHEFIKEE